MPTDLISTSIPGVQNPAVLDRVLHDPVQNRVILIMIETRPWSGSPGQLFEIQEKINSYLSFALDGEMVETHPELAGQAIGLQLDCLSYPDDKTIDFLDRIQQELAKQEIPFTLRVLEKAVPPTSVGPCVSSCSCAESK